MPLEIRQGRLEDWPALEQFNAATYAEQARFKGLQRFRWQFIDNPAAPCRNGKVPAFFAVEQGEIEGAVCAQPGTLILGGKPRKAAWIVDFMVRERQRGRGIGHRIHEAIAAEIPLLVTLTMAPATRTIAERLGCITLAPTHQFTRLVHLDAASATRILTDRTRYRPRLNRFVRAACALGAGAVVAAVANAGLALANVFRTRTDKSPATDLRIEEVTSFGAQTDVFWQRVQAGYPALFARDARTLNWRFSDAPDLDYRRFIAWRGSTMAGYVVLRRQDPIELPYGVIADLLTAREDEAARGALIDFALEHFGRTVAAVEAAASIPELRQALRARGFFVSRTVRPTVIAHDKALLADVMAKSGEFYFTKGDHDWDQIHPAGQAD